MTIENTEWLTIKEAAEISGVTKAAISDAISRNKLKARGFCNPHRWLIDPKKLEEYIKNKYSREKSWSKGEYSVKQTAEILGIPEQKVYYATRIGIFWVIHIDDIQKFQKNHLSQKIKNKAV